MNQSTTIELLQILIPVVIALITSSGFWVFISAYKDRKSHQTELLIGLAHDRIVQLGMHYITRGWITQDEYENLNVYLYKPYEQLGGNGSAKRIMLEVDRLKIVKNKIMDKITGDTLP
jgi:hypothetical protein